MLPLCQHRPLPAPRSPTFCTFAPIGRRPSSSMDPRQRSSCAGTAPPRTCCLLATYLVPTLPTMYLLPGTAPPRTGPPSCHACSS
eukprot:scaffold20662_cov66-Phaeocystis_antarctica.AAC.10